eukprot:CAMPEP_0172916650 /NCGR_PEP_ID=MMETSP1075-20121228/196788_1 /TAXON_ID=2916 /ORGANISM="Ceratium fusus, Strain PA161109" /LENGTH=137 /DNA_ID=CAMNT_0013775985 /DNA_START=703 /DNA_END=1113 /DNA_ORIENTATION=+
MSGAKRHAHCWIHGRREFVTMTQRSDTEQAAVRKFSKALHQRTSCFERTSGSIAFSSSLPDGTSHSSKMAVVGKRVSSQSKKMSVCVGSANDSWMLHWTQSAPFAQSQLRRCCRCGLGPTCQHPQQIKIRFAQGHKR